MKSKNSKIQILMKGILIILVLTMSLPASIHAIDGLTLQDSTIIEKIMYGEIGSVVRKIQEHFKSNATLYIVNETQLRALAEYVNSGNSCIGKNIELLNDINLNTNIDWTPIGNEYSEFAGTFNGNGYTISNLTYIVREDYQTNGGYSNIGLFGVVAQKGKINKINVNYSRIENSGLNEENIDHIGNIVGTNYGTILDCTANNMPLGKTPVVDCGDAANKFIGKIAGENRGTINNSESISINNVQINSNDSTINAVPKIFIQRENDTEYSEITNFINTIYLQNTDKLKVELTFDKYLYVGLEEGREIKLADEYNDDGELIQKASEEIYPQLTISGIKFNPISATREDESTITKLIYEAEFTNEVDKEIKNIKNLVMNFNKNKENKNLYVYFSEEETFNTGDKITNISSFNGIDITIDTEVPGTSIKSYVENVNEAGRYPEGKEIIIKVTSSEKIKATIAPEINVLFSESGKGKYNYQADNTKGNAIHVDAIIDEEGKTVWVYSYIIQPGDEGELTVEYLSGTIKDLGNNVTNLTELEAVKNAEIYADTKAPTLDITNLENVENTNLSQLKYTFKFSEEVRDFTQEDIKVTNGTLENFEKIDDTTYTATINTTIENGNVGQLQVVVEQDACKDIAGHSNVRTQKTITVDKKAPVLVSLESYIDSNIELSEEIDTVKEYYKAGETVKIVATFDENINSLEENITGLPKLALQFSESGNAKGIVSGTLEGNKIIYTYTLTNGDEGILSVKGFTGTIRDAVGNETIVTKRTLDGNTIIADTKVSTLESLKVTTPEGKYKEGKGITIEASFSEEVYALKDNKINNITSETAPILKVKLGEGEEKQVTSVEYGTLEGKTDKTKLVYTYTIGSEDEGNLSIVEFENTESTTVCDIAANEADLIWQQTGNTVTADNIRPEVESVTATVQNPTVNGTGIYYKAGNTVKITVQYSEEVYTNLFKDIKVAFSEEEPDESDYRNTIESDWNVNTDNIEYSYIIKEGDNGYLWVLVPEGLCHDEAGNSSKGYDLTKQENIFADTENPYLKVNLDTEITQEGQIITVKANFNENIYGLKNDSRINLSTSNAPKLLYGFNGVDGVKEATATNINGNVITYTITKENTVSGSFYCTYLKGNLYDRAGNEFYVEEIDTIAPKLERVEISTNAGMYAPNCNVEKEIYVAMIFDENIVNNNIKLKIKTGDGEERILENPDVEGKIVKYTYTVKPGDNGEFKILDVLGEIDTTITDNTKDNTYGYVQDHLGNQSNIYNLEGKNIIGNAVADTVNPYVTNIKVVTNGNEKEIYHKEEGTDATTAVLKTNERIAEYIVTYSEKIPYNHFDRIQVINGIIRKIEYNNFALNEYKVTVETIGEGVQSLILPDGTIEDKAGNLDSYLRVDSVIIDMTPATVRFISEYNGGTYVLPTNIGKVEVRPNIEINEDIASIEYKWTEDGEYKEIENQSSSSDITIPAQSFNEEGSYTLYIRVVDIAGNTTETTKTYNVKNSSIEIEANKYQPTNEDVILTVKFEEGLTDNKKVLFRPDNSNQVIELNAQGVNEDGTIQYSIQENGVVTAEATDRIGNKVFEGITIDNIDKVNPVVEIETNGANLVIGTGKDKATIKSNIEVEDENTVTIEYTITSVNTTLDYNVTPEMLKANPDLRFTNINNYGEAKIEDAIEGTYYLYVIATDEAGNYTIIKSNEYNIVNSNNTDVKAENTINFTRDKQIVEVNFGYNLTEERNITLTNENDGYEYDGYVQVLKPTTITAVAKDVCGNTVTKEYEVENVEGPEFNVIGNPSNWTKQDVKLEVQTYSELQALTVNGTDILSRDENVLSNIVVNQNGDYKFVATDVYGNISEKTITVSKIDKIAPTIENVTNSGKSITITARDEQSGILQYAISTTTEVPVEWDNSSTIKTTEDGTFYVWTIDVAGNVTRAENPIIVDTTAPTITFNYAALTVTAGMPLETNITTNEEAIITYSWDNTNWFDLGTEYVTSRKVSKKSTTIGTYVLYAKATDKFGNETRVETLEFKVVKAEDLKQQADIIFEDVPTVQVDGNKYVKISPNMTSDELTGKMNSTALSGNKPEYKNLTEDGKLKTGSEITLDNETIYIVIINGDVNGDGKVDFLEDVILANNYRIGLVKLNTIQKLAADVDNNGNIEFIEDIIRMNNYRLGIIKSL